MKSMIRQSLFAQEEFCSGVMNAPPKAVAQGDKNA